MNDKKLQDTIKRFEQELRDLKTAAKSSPIVRSFQTTFLPTSGIAPITITYGAGTQPIITNVYAEGTAILGRPSGNMQKVFYEATAPTTITIVSTRQILSVSQ